MLVYFSLSSVVTLTVAALADRKSYEFGVWHGHYTWRAQPQWCSFGTLVVRMLCLFSLSDPFCRRRKTDLPTTCISAVSTAAPMFLTAVYSLYNFWRRRAKMTPRSPLSSRTTRLQYVSVLFQYRQWRCCSVTENNQTSSTSTRCRIR